MLGVFPGIPAASWNEQRAEDIKAQAYLARIRSDLETDLQSIGPRLFFRSQVTKNATHYAETGELVNGSARKRSSRSGSAGRAPLVSAHGNRRRGRFAS